MKLDYFKTQDLHSALRTFFNNLNIPVNYIAEEPARPPAILAHTYKKNHPAFQLMDDVYFLGMIDDAAFDGSASLAPEKIKSDYDGILIFGVTLYIRDNSLLPTRSQLAEITRAFNREFHYTPVVVVFKYEHLIAFANAERLKYKQEWREGEKAGKVSLLRDVDIENPHSGHLRILSELAISRSGKGAINSFNNLYLYWQSVFNVSLLNKKFYEELSNWYFWAIKEVSFPSEPTIATLFQKTRSTDQNKLKELKQEHNAKNVIRLLTRFLFVWFIKEKKLIPPELFDHKYLSKELLKDLSPYHEEGLFKEPNIKSHYYKAILQNLFFATLNQEMGKRAFRRNSQNMNVTNLMRHETYFKNPQKFIDLVESTVPFMNGGLFECLDIPHPTKKGPKGGDVIIYKDGFSDRKDNQLVVPDYLFFGLDEEVDLSAVIGIENKQTRQAVVKGLINIFESYKFTITENTPIEEDIALDPELLGKVFENLLASYNPETKTTARKQTGSFYTPREIVNYMVDESLIAYLKNAIKSLTMPEDELDIKLHQLFSFDGTNPFEKNSALHFEIIRALDHCTILDPACGSGAFPMGVLQKIVHVLQKLDPENQHWHDLQMEKALKKTETAFNLSDKETRKQKLDEINEAFDRQVNDPDYARKLFLIENCIYGVDIQPIAAQISKLRFFISLVVDQKVDKTKPNFGIRPLPNLETKFVAANTLIGIDKPSGQLTLSTKSAEIKDLIENLKTVRHKIFNAKGQDTKKKYRNADKKIREKLKELLVAEGWENLTAQQLSEWDPYDQNASSSFFDSEWMFGIQDGFDIVIGNPPYGAKIPKNIFEMIKKYYPKLFCKESAILFIEKGRSLLSEEGILTYIVPKALTYSSNYKKTRDYLLNGLSFIVDCGKAFEQVKLEACVFSFLEATNTNSYKSVSFYNNLFFTQSIIDKKYVNVFGLYLNGISQAEFSIGLILAQFKTLGNFTINRRGGNFQKNIKMDAAKPLGVIGGKEITRYGIRGVKGYVDERFIEISPNSLTNPNAVICQNIVAHIQNPTDHIKIIACINEKENYLILDTINQIIIKQNTISKYYLWAVLNSKLINWYVYKFIYGKAIRTMHFDNPVTSRIPISIPTNLNLYKIFYELITTSKNETIFNDILDGLVLQEYFPEHMKEREIDILNIVESDILKVVKEKTFYGLSEDQKKQLIQYFNKIWTDEGSEIYKRIKGFSLKSPEILRPILESYKSPL